MELTDDTGFCDCFSRLLCASGAEFSKFFEGVGIYSWSLPLGFRAESVLERFCFNNVRALHTR
jgi:hypothetical protein